MIKNIKKFFTFKTDSASAGFTLTELLVTISIIGILSAVIGVNYTSARKSSRDAKRKADLENMAAAFEMYYSQHKKYPACPWDNAYATLNADGYLTGNIIDPLNKNDYIYKCVSADNWFGLYTKLEIEKTSTLNCGASCVPAQNNIKYGNGTYTKEESIYYRIVGK